MDKIIEANGLKKSYGKVQAVKDISFYVERGKLFAFLGPNGAGKSTTIDMICTFLKPDAGSVAIDGFELGRQDDQIRRIIGAVFQDHLLDDLLTVEENLRIRGSFYSDAGTVHKGNVKRVADVVGISDLLKRPYGKLSGGQRRRADIARALINTPKIMFLDEPTTGLDPQTRQSVWQTIQSLQRETGMTIFLTTHYMEEAAQADYVTVIDDGVLVARGSPTELKERYASDQLRLFPKDRPGLLQTLDELKLSYTNASDQVVLKLASTLDSLPIIEKCKSYIGGFEVVNGTMDDAFIGITGKEIRE
ncbi:MAG: ABC transporter ATP-binding protein [Bacillota bacterium]